MHELWALLTSEWAALTPLSKGAMIAWVAITVSLPLARWFWSDRGMRWSVAAGVVAQAAAVLAILGAAWGWGQAFLAALAIVCIGWGVEYVGSHTGFPFGRYHYTPRLQPQLGAVPLLIPLAWLMMVPPAWAVAQGIAGARLLPFAALGGIAMAAWDLFLDPQMVSWRLWLWDQRGGYFGIPWRNYAGWIGAVALMTLIVRPAELPQGLVLVYALTWLLETVGLGIFWRQPGPALCGFAGMGGMLLWWLLRL
ncbi:MAG: carotenoid biosynthesis protein [Anaerolineae bacterium]|nr:carotenoid biosynthesis protein [Anaerolineae bacterium]